MSSSSGVDNSQPAAEGLSSRNKAVQKNDEKKDDQPESKTEFAHSFPMHTHPMPSILSKDSTEGLSFRGFGNLGCKFPSLEAVLTEVLVMIFGNLRLVVENYVKVRVLFDGGF